MLLYFRPYAPAAASWTIGGQGLSANSLMLRTRPVAILASSTAWWAGSDSLADEEERAAAHGLYARLLKSMDRNGAERFVFERYCARYRTHGFDIPALIPQVYLHYDPYTRWTGRTLGRQRMDFLLLLDRRRRGF